MLRLFAAHEIRNQKQLSLIRRLDSSRPCSYASCQFKADILICPMWYPTIFIPCGIIRHRRMRIFR